MDSTFSYLRKHAQELGARILETYPPLQGTIDTLNPLIGSLLRKALPAQALAITGTAKYLSNHADLAAVLRRRILARADEAAAPSLSAVANVASG